MDNLDDSDNIAKISDSAYSASCSNSQSRSRSSKSTHSGSNSSGSSGYGGGQPSTSGSSKPPPAKRSKEKESKKKKAEQIEPPEPQAESEEVIESPTVPERPTEAVVDEGTTALSEVSPVEKEVENTDTVQVDATDIKEEVVSSFMPLGKSSIKSDGFSCVISMHDGVVMYTTVSLTATLGFPKEMWIGRSFIDFIHVKDRNTFASQITNGLAVPTTVNGTLEKVQSRDGAVSTMVCRIRCYRGLTSGFGVKERNVTFMPFLLKLTFKNVSDDTGDVIYLVVQATSLCSAFKEPNEIITNAKPFVMRHSSDGNLEYIDPESVSYLGFLPQDILGKDMLHLYHHNDLPYLKEVYETIVEKGGLVRSKPYRMMTQNHNYIKLETEWSSFINPWSRKLEFVTGKHYILEGPCNPDVFGTPVAEKQPKILEEEKKKQQEIRDNIVKIMNEVLTKPAKLAKQLMSKRCQDLASFMESLMEDQPRPDGELHIEINDQDHNYYDRNSMLGGISPHHDYNDSKSSTETPPSYNQFNYNETLQRYFESHQPFPLEESNRVPGDQKLSLKNPKPQYSSPNCLSPLTQNFGDAGELTSSCESGSAVRGSSSPVSPFSDRPQLRLTESLLNKHNEEMEKEMRRLHREIITCTKGDREKVITENKQKKLEHLARCNVTYSPTTADTILESSKNKLHGVKRTSKPVELDSVSHKHHCPTSRQPHRRHTTSTAEVQPSATITTSMAASHWYNNQVNNANTFLLGVEMPQRVPLIDPAIMQPMVAMPGIPVQCLMYGQAVYGSPIMYSAIGPQVTYPVQQTMMSQTMRYTNLFCGQINNPDVKPPEQTNSSEPQTTERANVPTPSCSAQTKVVDPRPNEETVDKTDEESSYSSFYSSFFKTESGSAEESNDPKKGDNKTPKVTEPTPPQEKGAPFETGSTSYAYDNDQYKKTPPKRKLKPSWMEQVCVTSELIYKYQVMTKSMEEVLQSDKQKISELAQPSLVNEQLGQLYLDLQLEGVAARLTLEEGITSSSSSGEENSNSSSKDHHRKREHSKLVMIYEEDAPLPPPNVDDDVETIASSSV